MSSDSVANDAVPTGIPGETEQRTAPAQDQASISEQDEAAAARTKEYAEVHSEALRRLEYCQSLPPSIFDYILQTLCCISYTTIIIPFYLDNKWTLATLDHERKEITVYGPATEHEGTAEAATSLAASWLDADDNVQTWSKTYIPMGPPAVYWNQSIVCLVAAVHMFAGVAPPHQDPDTILWRCILAALPAYSPLADGDHLDKSVMPDDLVIPPPPSHGSSTPSAPLTKLLAPSFLAAQRDAYAVRRAEVRGLAAHTDALLSAMRRVPSAAAACSDVLMKELCAMSEGARMLVKADAPRVEGLERLMMMGGGGGGSGGGGGGGRAVGVGRFVGGLVEGAEGRVRRLVEGWERVWGGVEAEWGALAGMFGKTVSGGEGDGGPCEVIGAGAATTSPRAMSAENGQGKGGSVAG
ncbi:hypothetical protein BFW01_g10223 [Lasiodiplodia theobromae]|uniref:Uncharacterized protein n=1 Tax=Lasiodiplodia theobromae TaxID=45133 RepID=A0A8H7IPB3_9PEZI|nr:hypothetical protein BFW01_g10223 [Lasiodiplodia theobromae]